MIPFSVLVPFRPDNGHRERAWDWISQRWEQTLPEAEVLESLAPPGDHPGDFNHPAAINQAADAAAHDVFIVADADTAFSPNWVREAVELVFGGAKWVLPSQYRKIDKPSTAKILEGDPAGPIEGYECEWIGDSVNWSGLVVVPREGFEKVQGYDERWEMWGSDDAAFALSMETLWGHHHRLPGSAYHLWHPAPLEETYGHERHAQQHRLHERYVAAEGDVDAMSALVLSR